MAVAGTAASVTTVCAAIGVSVCAIIVVPQTEQCEPSVKPVAVQVAAMAVSVTTMCSIIGVSVCDTKTFPQTEQCEPSVKPVVVQVAGTAVSVTTVCASNIAENDVSLATE